MAAHFRDAQGIPFTLLVDHGRDTYEVLELGRGTLMAVAGPRVWAGFAKGIVTGKGVARPKQDPFQLAGAVVADKGGKVLYVHRNTTSSDDAPVEDLLAALP